MSNLDKALETLKETKKGTEWGDRMHKEAIEYLESLKPTIPIFVARWFEKSIKDQMDIYRMVNYYDFLRRYIRANRRYHRISWILNHCD